MWLRDSAAQVRPYLYLAARDEELADIIEGLVKRQFACILIDPYANAFNEKPDGSCWEKDFEDQDPGVCEKRNMRSILCAIRSSWLIFCGSLPAAPLILMRRSAREWMRS